jgi:hypothetical protein
MKKEKLYFMGCDPYLASKIAQNTPSIFRIGQDSNEPTIEKEYTQDFSGKEFIPLTKTPDAYFNQSTIYSEKEKRGTNKTPKKKKRK